MNAVDVKDLGGRRTERPAGRLIGRALAVAAIVGVTMLGNLRSQASAQASEVARADPSAPVRLIASSSVAEADAGHEADASDELHLVPAIYAWDPDVRYVYFRHVSKWM